MKKATWSKLITQECQWRVLHCTQCVMTFTFQSAPAAALHWMNTNICFLSHFNLLFVSGSVRLIAQLTIRPMRISLWIPMPIGSNRRQPFSVNWRRHWTVANWTQWFVWLAAGPVAMPRKIWPKMPIWCGSRVCGHRRFRLPFAPIIWAREACWHWPVPIRRLRAHQAWLATVWPRRPFISWPNRWRPRIPGCRRTRWSWPFYQLHSTHRWIASGCQRPISPHGHRWSIWLSEWFIQDSKEISIAL